MSACAWAVRSRSQILTIQLAIQAKLKRFIFEDTEIDLNPACSVYITMNPGYAGACVVGSGMLPPVWTARGCASLCACYPQKHLCRDPTEHCPVVASPLTHAPKP